MAQQTDQAYSQWAVLDNLGQKICDYTSIVSLDAENSSQVPTEPIEGGQLASFNKVQDPNMVDIELAFDGDYAVQQGALDDLDSAIDSTKNFTIYSPSKIWRNMNLIVYSQSRATGANATLLTVRAHFQQIISVNLKAQRSAWSPRNPTSANKTNTGKKQPSSVTKNVSDYLRGS